MLASAISSGLPWAVHAVVSHALPCFSASIPASTMPAAPKAESASWITAAAASPTAVIAASVSAGYIGNDTTCAHTRSPTAHMAGLVDARAGCRGIGTG